MDLGIAGKTAVITWASSGIGRHLGRKSGDGELFFPVVGRLIGSKH